MAQILVPFFRKFVDKDKVPDTEETVAAESQEEADRPGSTTTQDGTQAVQHQLQQVSL